MSTCLLGLHIRSSSKNNNSRNHNNGGGGSLFVGQILFGNRIDLNDGDSAEVKVVFLCSSPIKGEGDRNRRWVSVSTHTMLNTKWTEAKQKQYFYSRST